jgi:hypothetical protein
MSLESSIFDALKGLVTNRVYPDQAPQKVDLPYIVYQQVGGGGVNFMDTATPSKKNARIQISVWGSTRAQVAPLARSAEDALRAAAGLQVVVLAAPVALTDDQTKYRGTQQDFSIWYT